MYLTAMLRGVVYGFLEPDDFTEAIELGWTGLMSTINSDGSVNGICDGTGIQPNATDYEDRPTLYLASGPGGLGSLLYACVEMQGYISNPKFSSKLFR